MGNFVTMVDKHNLDNVVAQSDYMTRYSILNNAYFSAPFFGFVALEADNLVIGLMSNHSAQNPG